MLLVTGFVFCKFCIIGMPDFRPPCLCFLNVINYFLLLIKQMCFHQFLCLYRISAGNGIKQFPMFLHKIRALANIFHIFHAVTIELFAQIIDNRNKAVIVCCAENEPDVNHEAQTDQFVRRQEQQRILQEQYGFR